MVRLGVLVLFLNILVFQSLFATEAATTADAGEDQTIAGSSTTLDGSGSISSGGSITSYTWELKSWPKTTGNYSPPKPSSIVFANSSNAITTVSGLYAVGDYVFQLTVKDNLGATNTDQVTITSTLPTLPLSGEIGPWKYTPVIDGWDTSPFKPYILNYGSSQMPFRVIYPVGYNLPENAGKQYPLLLMMHGKGEKGTNNDFQLKHGGEEHRDAVLGQLYLTTSNTVRLASEKPNDKNLKEVLNFDGFVVFPQTQSESWSNVARAADIISALLSSERIDIDKVHVHGLSAGGTAAWRLAASYPRMFATVVPMSSAPLGRLNNIIKNSIHLPMWTSQGGYDSNPSPDEGNQMYNSIKAQGANITYNYYANRGHNTWSAMYREPDFFPFFKRYSKLSILVFFGRTQFCADDVINVKLGITQGFKAYEWQKNGVTISGATSNEITVTDVGLYRVRFKRSTTWTEWSEPVDINRNQPITPATTIVAKGSTALPGLDGSTSVELKTNTEFEGYQWAKNTANVAETNQNIIVTTPGSYALSVKETGGCFSNLSNALYVSVNGTNGPIAPDNFFTNPLSETSIEMQWNDRSNNETGYEIYRSSKAAGPYSLIKVTGENVTTFTDVNLAAGKTYYYRLRGYNNGGGSAYVQSSATTLEDVQAPTAPQNLQIAYSTDNSIQLVWDASTDNVGVSEYEVYQKGVLVGITSQTSFLVEGLTKGAVYNYTVRAKDVSGNYSPYSNQVTGAAVSSGLNYTYYEHDGLNYVSQIESSQVIKTGKVPNITLAPRERDDNFAFKFEGIIRIPTTGTYTFYTKSDDGSKLYINNQEVVDNDTPHGTRETSGEITLNAGTYPFKALYFENGGGEVFEVRYKGPGISKQLIPDEAFVAEFEKNPPAVPTNLVASSVSFSEIGLTWKDNSSGVAAFEVYRSTSSNGTFSIIFTTTTGAIAYNSTGLQANTTYYYKLKAISSGGESAFSNVASATTGAAPAKPTVPANLTATAQADLKILLNWQDQSSNETGFEIFRSITSGGTYYKIGETGANTTSFTVEGLFAHSTYYFVVRAKNEGGVSSYSNEASGTTPNSNPKIQNIPDRTARYDASLTLNIGATDADLDPITITATTAPAFITFTDNGNGTATLVFPARGIAEVGMVYSFEITAADGFGGSSTETFAITVSDNYNPVLAEIADQELTEGKNSSVTISATDQNAGDVITFSSENLPSFVTITNQGNGTALLSFQPVVGDAGFYPNINILANDGKGGIDEQQFNITVKGIKKSFNVSVNFGADADQTPAGWNPTKTSSDLPANTKFASLLDNAGENSGIGLTLPQTKWSSYTNGLNTNEDSGIYPDLVMKNYYRFTSGTTKNIVLDGLNAALTYNLTFFSNIDNESSYRYTSFTSNGETKTIDPNKNAGKLIQFSDLTPDANGKITISVAKATVNGQSSTMALVNSLVINAYYDDGTPPAAPSTLTATAISGSEVALAWEDNSYNETVFEIYRASALSGNFVLIASVGVDVTALNDTEDLAGKTTYFYKIRAVNKNGASAYSDIVQVTTLNNAPVISTIESQTITVGETKELIITAVDPEEDQLTLEISGLPAFATFELSEIEEGVGTITMIPTGKYENTQYQVTVTATDQEGASSTQTFAISVVGNDVREVVYVNFDKGNLVPAPWNNFNKTPNAGANLSNILNSVGVNTGIGITVNQSWTGSVKNGMNTGHDNGIYPDKVSETAWKVSSAAGTVSLQITGLNPALRYNFELFGSVDGSLDTNKKVTSYSINGVTVSLDAVYNSSKTVQLNNIIPNASGVVTLNVAAASGSVEGFLNALVIHSYNNDGTLLAPSNLVAKAKAMSRTAVSLTWNDNSGSETGFEIYRSKGLNAPFTLVATTAANIRNYDDENLESDYGYYYKVRAIDAANAKTSAYSGEVYVRTSAYHIAINFNGTGHASAAAPWNNFSQNPFENNGLTNLNDDAGVNTGIDILITDGFMDANELGMTTGIYPSNAMLTSYYLEDGEDNTQQAEFMVSELDPAEEYNFIIFASRNGSGNRKTDYYIENSTVSLNASYNTSNTAEIMNVAPDEFNRVIMGLNKQDDALYGYINTLVIEATSAPDLEAPTAPTDLKATPLLEAITLSWQPSTDNRGVVRYDIYDAGMLIESLDVAIGEENPSIEISIQEGLNYEFTVVAVDAQGNQSPHSLPLGYPEAAQPVEFLTLTGKVVNGNVVIEWSTASEFNNDYFTVERSTDGKSFSSIGTVDGAGTTNNMNNYKFTDKNPPYTEVYYRIKQTDFDGESAYSNVISVNLNPTATNLDIVLYPNPATKNNINLKVESTDTTNPIFVTIFDTMGKTYFSNNYEFTNQESLKIAENATFNRGLYLVKVQQRDQTIVKRLIIVE